MIEKLNKIVYALLIILLFFNGYYFFIYRSSFVNFITQEDNIIEKSVYKDLSEEYKYLNKKYSCSKIVFLGDSITKRFNINEFSKNKKIINRGIFFDTTKGLLNRIDFNINNLKIEKLFIMIGYNDLKFRTNIEIIENVRKILIKIKCSNKVYLQSILPVAKEEIKTNERIFKINSELIKIAEEQKVNYIDLYSHFKTSNNFIQPELTSDGVHPNYYGYRKWFIVIEPLL